MKNRKFILMFIFISIFTISELMAIPAFARKYKLSCQTCHSPMPRLKSFGDDFAGNGFRMPEMESSRYYVDTGDDQLSLIRDFPIAVRLDMHAVMKTDDYANGVDFQSPYLVKLLSGGELAKNLAYYFYFYMDERGEVVGVEDAYIMFNDLFGHDLDLYMGQFQVSDPLFKRELRLTLEDYEVYKTKVGFASSNLAYDRGLMLTLGLESGTDIIFEIINGNGIHEADALKNFDKDKHKNFFGRISQDVTDFLRIGGFGYIGKEMISDEMDQESDNKIVMWGPDFSASFEDIVELNFQYVLRKDDSPYGQSSRIVDIETNGGLAEIIVTPGGDESNLYFVCLYNWVKSDLELLEYQTLTLHTGYMFRRNLRMVAEFKHDFEQKYNMFSVGIVSAF